MESDHWVVAKALVGLIEREDAHRRRAGCANKSLDCWRNLKASVCGKRWPGSVEQDFPRKIAAQATPGF
jgi:hypothetical protein